MVLHRFKISGYEHGLSDIFKCGAFMKLVSDKVIFNWFGFDCLVFFLCLACSAHLFPFVDGQPEVGPSHVGLSTTISFWEFHVLHTLPRCRGWQLLINLLDDCLAHCMINTIVLKLDSVDQDEIY